MEQSPGDQSPVKFAYPFAQPPDVFHVPRLGIIHFLAWMAVSAILFGFLIKTEFFNILQIRDLARPYRLFVTTHTVFIFILSSSVIVGACVILGSRWRGVRGRLQAGHWMLVKQAVLTVLILPLWLLYISLQRYLSTNYPHWNLLLSVSLQTFSSLISFGIWLTAIFRMKEPFRWKALFSIFASINIIWSLMFVSSLIDSSLLAVTFLPIGATISLLATPLIAGMDLVDRVPRDWLHWLGVAVAVIFQFLDVSNYLAKIIWL